ncbi:N-formylmaleamate deformylase [Castellaniella defragrans]
MANGTNDMTGSTYLYGANVNANGIRQHYLRFSSATEAVSLRPSLILVPGITSPAVTWAFVGERLGRFFDTYILDVRGRGLSEASDALDYSLDAQSADLVGFAKGLGLKKFMFVGHSMGGRIVIRAASRRPEGLERVVAVDPPVSGPGRRPYPSQLPWYVDSIRQSLKGMTADQMRAFCPTWSDEQLRLRAEWLHTCDERAIVTSFNGFQSNDIHRDLPKIDVPFRLIAAANGDVIRPEEADEILGLVPDGSLVRVPDAGHMIPWDNEPGFYAAFGDFLGCPLGDR